MAGISISGGQRAIKRIIIIGGGLAGISAAVELAKEECQVTLIERKRLLGGRASSYYDAKIGGMVDIGQHILMGCCTNLLSLYESSSVMDFVIFSKHIVFAGKSNGTVSISPSALPAPLHLLPSLMRFSELSLRERLSIIGLFNRISKSPHIESCTSVAEWLMRSGQSSRTLDSFWGPVLVSALNEDPQHLSAAMAFMVLREGFLKNRGGYAIGVAQAPLSELHHTAFIRVLETREIAFRLGMAAQQLRIDNNRVVGVVLDDGEILQADYVISAVPPGALMSLLPDETMGLLAALRDFKDSPITTVQIRTDANLQTPPFVALLGGRYHWIFRIPWITNGAAFQLVASASRQFEGIPNTQLAQWALEELRATYPEIHAARVNAIRVLRQPHATLSLSPDIAERRPGPMTTLTNLVLAGDWTATGWPATMESAVRSGYRAAECVLGMQGIERNIVRPDLPPDGLSRWLPAFRHAECSGYGAPWGDCGSDSGMSCPKEATGRILPSRRSR